MMYGKLLLILIQLFLKKFLNKCPLCGDIQHLDDIITIPTPDEITQKHKDELDNIELHTDKHGNKIRSYN